jgi:heptosyltransferase-2
VLLVLLKFFGRFLAIAPEWFVRGGCVFLGSTVGVLRPERRRTTLRNLHHAFPDRSERWRRRVFRESCARMLEMGIFLPASAYMPRRRIDEALVVGDEVRRMASRYINGDRKGTPVVFMVPHMTMSEAANLLPKEIPGLPTVHTIFRPLNQPALNRWVVDLRSRYGSHLLSRRNGYNDAMGVLRKGGIVGVLFDQDASGRGATSFFMDRLVSMTDLPGLMATRFDADVYLLLPERRGFWRGEMTMRALPKCDSATEVNVHAHNLLEAYLRRDFNSAADWLWLHGRWGHRTKAHKRFSFPEKRNRVALTNEINGHAQTPRKTRLWVRMPNWLGDVVMALPLLRAIRRGRPDFEITLIGKAAFQPLFERLGVGDRFIALPKSGRGYFSFFHKLRLDYPDTYLMFTNSPRSDLEAFLTRCPQRMGMLRPGKWRPLLTDPFALPADVDESAKHQTHVWEQMMRSYGLLEPLDCAPLPREAQPAGRRPQIGLICGTENAPEKRWPVGRWRSLIEQLLATYPNVEVLLFGTPADRTITDAVAAGFAEKSVRNLAGQTDLAAFCDGLKNCNVVACNDTGGMHLANMLGTPVVAVFGPTNPLRTGPIFDSPAYVLQPDGCPAGGGAAIAGVASERVLGAVRPYLEGARA